MAELQQIASMIMSMNGENASIVAKTMVAGLFLSFERSTAAQKSQLNASLAPSENENDAGNKKVIIDAIAKHVSTSALQDFVKSAVHEEKYELALMYLKAKHIVRPFTKYPCEYDGEQHIPKWKKLFSQWIEIAPDWIYRLLAEEKIAELQTENEKLRRVSSSDERVINRLSCIESEKAELSKRYDALSVDYDALSEEAKNLRADLLEAKRALENISRALGFLTEQ